MTEPAIYLLPERLTWRALDGVWVVYQARTGAMYPLDLLSASVLTVLESQPLSAASLGDQLASEAGLAERDELAVSVQAALDQLCQLGLVAQLGGPAVW